ncbi:MAG: ubiquitin family protein [Candidatus Heimdallarchaeota archaeon]|nr:ubiquitin family protein [Candidatus Heimdallarchaeota archaeon]MDH5646261.1 ubiquitin family protein [Candidatus Heimdallarchaeota archaeon]
MEIEVVSAIGGGAPIRLQVEPHETVAKLKAKVAQERRIPASTVIVVFRGQQLDDAESLKAVGIADGDKCYLITRTEGGKVLQLVQPNKILTVQR